MSAPVRPSISLTRLRPLQLVSHPEGRPPHLAAGSGIVMLGDTAHVIADDELHLGRFEATSQQPGILLRALEGALPSKPAARKQAKPDLEALVRVPARPDLPHGALLAIPSMSRPNRVTGFLWPLGATGAVGATAMAADFSGVLSELGVRAGGQVNLEGAAVVGSRLMLFNRGTALQRNNASIELNLDAVLGAILAAKPVPVSSVAGSTSYDLGELDGVPLGFTDATATADGRIVFTAAAEQTDDAYDHGTVVGSVVGVIDRDGTLRGSARLGGRHKIEGVALLDDGRSLRLVDDADDPSRAASLFAATLPADL